MSTPVRAASTVVLLRDGADGIEVWLLTRALRMAFAPGMSVFPGGRVEPTDASLPWASGDPSALANRLGCDVPTARSLAGAAVRETFEETGVLLARPADDPDMGGEGAAASESAAGGPTNARAVEARSLDFGALLRAHRLAIDAAALRPWARWITPEGETRRYDTWFFVAEAPAGAAPDNVTSEAIGAGWVPVARALAEAADGARRLMPPTLATLRQVGGRPSVADVLAAAPAQPIAPVRPRINPDRRGVTLPDGTVMAFPPGIRP
ncbi:MAG: NUDIX domain-containing protein [Actinomycetia bacterium]|nr:NUDIX domain-containing protein [Actinomycetes bacterium]